jgi:hypothetical protein
LTWFARWLGLYVVQPASIRLMDNPQFQFGQALKAAPHSTKEVVVDKFKKLYVFHGHISRNQNELSLPKTRERKRKNSLKLNRIDSNRIALH